MTTLCERIRIGLAQSRVAHGERRGPGVPTSRPSVVVDEERLAAILLLGAPAQERSALECDCQVIDSAPSLANATTAG
jgi:hypothetical protein